MGYFSEFIEVQIKFLDFFLILIKTVSMDVRTFPISNDIIEIPIMDFQKLVDHHVFFVSVGKSELTIKENDLYSTELKEVNDSDVALGMRQKADEARKQPLSEYVNI